MTTSHDPGQDAPDPKEAPQEATSVVHERHSGDDHDDVDEFADPELETDRATY